MRVLPSSHGSPLPPLHASRDPTGLSVNRPLIDHPWVGIGLRNWVSGSSSPGDGSGSYPLLSAADPDELAPPDLVQVAGVVQLGDLVAVVSVVLAQVGDST